MISPGQRQRIALARALYGEPKLVILDEPNSNLDGAGEQALAETLKALRGQATVVVVTHRATLIQHVDKMLVLDAGKVQHYGPAAEVMRAMQHKAQRRRRRGRWRHAATRGHADDPGLARGRSGIVSAAVMPPPTASAAGAAPEEARRLARWAGAVLLLGIVPVAAWLTFAPLSAAVVAGSFVKVDLDRRVVQHAEGGTVRQVLVRDGQHVAQGEPLLVLGDVSVDADLNRLNYRVMAERASLARLEAEQSVGRPSTSRPKLLAAAADPRLAEQITKERSLFSARRDALVGQSELLRAQQGQGRAGGRRRCGRRLRRPPSRSSTRRPNSRPTAGC